MRLKGYTRLVALNNYQLNTGCRAEKNPYQHDLFSQFTRLSVDIAQLLLIYFSCFLLI